MKQVVALVSGFVFAVGLALGGMTDPRKVLAFLDVGGAWDPTLMFVMGGALLVLAPVVRWTRGRSAPVLERRWFVPERGDVDARLIGGATLFGIGWGLSGYCPGPAIAGTMTFGTGALVFTGAMLTGMAIFAAWQSAYARND